MSTKYTQGEWIFKFGEAYTVISKTDKGRIAILTNLKGDLGLGGRRDPNEVSANARLIAAAPELLEALQAIIESGEIPYSQSSQLVVNAKSAISKALGEQV